MKSLTLQRQEVEFLGRTMIVTAKVNLVPFEEIWAKLPPELRNKPKAKHKSLRGETFTVKNALTGEDQVFSYDVVLDAFPDVNFDEMAVEFESEAVPAEGVVIMPDEFDAELKRRGLRQV